MITQGRIHQIEYAMEAVKQVGMIILHPVINPFLLKGAM